jgi:DNA polymerase-3 subunit delta'
MTAGWGAMAESAAARALSHMIAAGRLPHALLLAGPAQVGKAQLATSLAQALNCDAGALGPGDPCGECRPCRRIAAARHADFEVVAPGGICRESDHDHSRAASIGICQIRRLEVVAALNPYEGRRRVFVIDPADAMTNDASDAFLKTLEEPPDAVTLVLVTDSPARLSETVRSRCRRVEVAPLRREALAARLAGTDDVTPEDADALARMARGRAGWALSAIAEGDPLAQRRAAIENLRQLSAGSAGERLEFAQSVTGRRGDLGPTLEALDCWREWWRDVLRVRLGVDAGLTHEFLRAELQADAPRYRPNDIAAFLREVRRTEELLRIDVRAQVALEALMLALPRPAAERSAA